MNWLDITLLCLAGVGFLKGLFDGIIKQVVSLIALVVGIFFCAKVAAWLRTYIIGWGFPEQGVTVLSYILGFLLIVGLLLLAGEIMHRVVGKTPLSLLNHLGGGCFGLLMMALFLSLALNTLEIIDRGSVLIPRESKVESHIYYPIQQIIPTLYPRGLFSF
ncbi:MAG: CvpA family protein [Tannerellaceae bacterium]|jgi:membrane protein required for colicin V production|nr:CvpA family protein [Tannerellaceae bacterium]